MDEQKEDEQENDDQLKCECRKDKNKNVVDGNGGKDGKGEKYCFENYRYKIKLKCLKARMIKSRRYLDLMFYWLSLPTLVLIGLISLKFELKRIDLRGSELEEIDRVLFGLKDILISTGNEMQSSPTQDQS